MKRYKDTKYLISEFGDVYSEISGRFLYLTLNNWGYLQVKLGKYSKTHPVHRLVAECYIPNPENKPQVNHKDGNKQNNHYSNLEWVTIKENINHSWLNGLSRANYGNKNSQGEKCSKSKLKECDIIEIRRLYQTNEYTYKDLASKYKVGISAINKILNYKTWKHV